MYRQWYLSFTELFGRFVEVAHTQVLGACTVFMLARVTKVTALHNAVTGVAQTPGTNSEGAKMSNAYESEFASALSYYEEGHFARAASIWNAMLIKSPTNLLCLRATHFAYEMAGDFANMRDMVPRILHAWNDTMPGNPGGD